MEFKVLRPPGRTPTGLIHSWSTNWSPKKRTAHPLCQFSNASTPTNCV